MLEKIRWFLHDLVDVLWRIDGPHDGCAECGHGYDPRERYRYRFHKIEWLEGATKAVFDDLSEKRKAEMRLVSGMVSAGKKLAVDIDIDVEKRDELWLNIQEYEKFRKDHPRYIH